MSIHRLMRVDVFAVTSALGYAPLRRPEKENYVPVAKLNWNKVFHKLITAVANPIRIAASLP